MDKKVIVLYVHVTGISVDAIHEDLVRVPAENAVDYSTVTKYVRSEKFPARTMDFRHSR
jgi:hypothetical protein